MPGVCAPVLWIHVQSLCMFWPCITVFMLQLRLKHTHRSPPLSPWHIFALRDKCPTGVCACVRVCVLVLFKAGSICLLQCRNRKSHLDSMSVFT